MALSFKKVTTLKEKDDNDEITSILQEKQKYNDKDDIPTMIKPTTTSFLLQEEEEIIMSHTHYSLPLLSSMYKLQTHIYLTTSTTTTTTLPPSTTTNSTSVIRRLEDNAYNNSDDDDYNNNADDDDLAAFYGDSGDSTDFLFDDITPITDISIDGVVASLGFNIIICVSLIVLYEVLRRLLPEVYMSKRTIRLIRRGKKRGGVFRNTIEKIKSKANEKRRRRRKRRTMEREEVLLEDGVGEEVESDGNGGGREEWVVENNDTFQPPPPPPPSSTPPPTSTTSTAHQQQTLYDSSSLSVASSTDIFDPNNNNNNNNNANKSSSSSSKSSAPPTLPPSPIPLNWLVPIYGVSWKQLRHNAGLDAYMFLRFIRLCLRITAVSAFWSMAILAPVYATGGNHATGFYLLSMANIPNRSDNNGTENWRLWISCVFIYLLSGFVFFVMKQEYRHYIELRMEFLGRADVRGGSGSSLELYQSLTEEEESLNGSFSTRSGAIGERALSSRGVNPQHHYSLMVERIPLDLRSDTALFDYFDSLFPGKVHSACVVLNLPDLEALSSRRLRVTRRLEKSIAHYEATGVRPTHTVGRWRCMCCGVEFIGASRGCSCCNLGKHHDMNDPTPIQKGEIVDSISYYTRDLAEMNQQLFLLQQSKLRVADSGRQSMRAERWFSKALNMTNEVCEDVLKECKIDEGLALMVSSEEDDINWSSSTDDGDETEDEDDEDIDEKESFEKLKQNERYYGYGGGGGAGITKYGSIEKNLESGDTTPAVAVGAASTNALVEPTNNLVGTSQPSSDTVIMQGVTPKTATIGDGESLEQQTANKSITWAPQNETRLMDGPPSSTTKKLRYASNRQSILSETQPKFGKEFSSWPKRLAGRLGLDFVVAGIKYANKQLDVVVESAVGATMSTVGFVTFLDLSSVTCSASTLLTHKPNVLDVKVAPEPRDIIWKNAHIDRNVLRGREFFANVLLTLGAILWSIPLAMIQALATADSLARIPGMEWILTFDEGTLRAFINGYLPVLALLGLIVLLPVLFQAIAVHYEGRKTLSDVQASIMGRYFYYQLANIFITVTAGSIYSSLADVIDRPSAILEILGTKLPTVVGYFISLLITKILAGLPVIILRFGALSRMLFFKACFRERKMTQREMDEIYREENLLYGWEYPTQLLVIVICFTYAVISPIILPVGALYFFGALMVYKKQALYVYTPRYESGGLLFPTACDRTIFGLICGQITFIGYTVIREAIYQPIFLFPLPLCSIWVMWYFRRHYAIPSQSLSLERAMELDHISDGKMSVAGSPLSPKSSKGRRPGLLRASKSIFSADAYRQPVLAEKAMEPLPYRRGHEDPMTEEAKSHLQGRYQKMTETGSNPTLVNRRDLLSSGNGEDQDAGNFDVKSQPKIV